MGLCKLPRKRKSCAIVLCGFSNITKKSCEKRRNIALIPIGVLTSEIQYGKLKSELHLNNGFKFIFTFKEGEDAYDCVLFGSVRA